MQAEQRLVGGLNQTVIFSSIINMIMCFYYKLMLKFSLLNPKFNFTLLFLNIAAQGEKAHECTTRKGCDLCLIGENRKANCMCRQGYTFQDGKCSGNTLSVILICLSWFCLFLHFLFCPSLTLSTPLSQCSVFLFCLLSLSFSLFISLAVCYCLSHKYTREIPEPVPFLLWHGAQLRGILTPSRWTKWVLA